MFKFFVTSSIVILDVLENVFISGIDPYIDKDQEIFAPNLQVEQKSIFERSLSSKNQDFNEVYRAKIKI